MEEAQTQGGWQRKREEEQEGDDPVEERNGTGSGEEQGYPSVRQTTINSRGIVLRVIERGFIRGALSIENVLDPVRQQGQEESGVLEENGQAKCWREREQGPPSVRCCLKGALCTVTE